jgi:hypothetical protein
VLPPKDEFAHRLDVFKKDVEASKKKLKISRAITKENKPRAMQGEDYFQDVELKLWKVESNIATIKKKMCEVENK